MERVGPMAWIQKHLQLAPRRRGFHLITPEIEAALPGLATIRVGLMHAFIQHTSASLCLGTWQGIYLCEHRDHGGPRRLVLTVHGERSPA
jgi:thiamine phosphate synthase YjbQ (UPF0047 family)